MSVGLSILFVVLLALSGTIPSWGHGSWGYAPSAVIGALLLIVLILILAGPNLAAGI